MQALNAVPFPVLSTKRLQLRQLTIDDEKEIFLIRSDPRVLEYLDRDPCKDIGEARQFINKIIDNNEWYYWAITLVDNPRLIGTICLWNFTRDKLKAEIGYELLPEHQGQGYMNEAIVAVLSFGFNTLHLDSIDGEVDPENLKSIKLLEKFGFTLSVSPDKNIDENGKVLPTAIYSLTDKQI